MEEKLDAILKNQGIIIAMLTTIIEAIPGPGKQPDVKKMLEPLLNNPLFRDNPMMAEMMSNFTKNMGGQ